MLPLLKKCFSLSIAVILCVTVLAQPSTRDTTRRFPTIPPSTGPRPYKEVITDKAKTDDGLFKVHKIDDKYFFEIPDSLMNRDILVVNRISKAAAGMRIGGLLNLFFQFVDGLMQDFEHSGQRRSFQCGRLD